MSKPVKVYNKGVRPVVFKRNRTGVDAIQPRKFLIFDKEQAAEIIKTHENACSEADYKKHLEAEAKKAESARKKAESEAK